MSTYFYKYPQIEMYPKDSEMISNEYINKIIKQ